MSNNPKRQNLMFWNIIKRLFQRIKICFNTFTDFIKLFAQYLLQIIIMISHNTVQRWDKFFAVCLLLFWITILLSSFFIPGSFDFEGDIVVGEMNFTYTGIYKRLFIDSIDSIKKLDIKGRQRLPIKLTGKFSSSDASLNTKLKNLKSIEIEFSSAESYLDIMSANSISQLSLSNFQIFPESKINYLTYKPEMEALSFCILSANTNPGETDQDDCIYPERVLNIGKSVGNLVLKLGQQSLIVTLQKVNIPSLGITNKDEGLTFEFNPAETKLGPLEIESPTRLFIQLSHSIAQKRKTTDSPVNIWGDIDVDDVNFETIDARYDPRDTRHLSTIINGKVRILNQTIELQTNQFLIVFSKKPGINKLHYIQLNIQSPKGLHLQVSGKSKGIAVGLSRTFPVQKIQPSWLFQQGLTQDAINAILALVAALTAILLPRLFT